MLVLGLTTRQNIAALFFHTWVTNWIAGCNECLSIFQQNIPKTGGRLPAFFELDVTFPFGEHDRGDAAMIAFGTTHFLLASGNRARANEIWPLIDWCLKYTANRVTADGVVASESDELEGRFPSGPAYLSNSSLYYGALM